MQYLLEPARDQIISMCRQAPDGEFEDGCVRHAAIKIRLEHGQFVKIGEQRRVLVVYPTGRHYFSVSMIAPASRICWRAMAPSSGFTLTGRVASWMTCTSYPIWIPSSAVSLTQ